MDKIISVKVVSKARKNEVVVSGAGYKIYVTAPPEGGKANKALIEALAGHLGLKKAQLEIIRGEKSKNKIIRIRSLT